MRQVFADASESRERCISTESKILPRVALHFNTSSRRRDRTCALVMHGGLLAATKGISIDHRMMLFAKAKSPHETGLREVANARGDHQQVHGACEMIVGQALVQRHADSGAEKCSGDAEQVHRFEPNLAG
jgi:hypothetical protein